MAEFIDYVERHQIEGESALEKWEKLGFTKGIDDKRIKIMTAEWFEKTAQYFLNNEEAIKELTKDKVLDYNHLVTVIFPIIRRCTGILQYIQSLRDNPELMCKEIIDYWEECKNFVNMTNGSIIDEIDVEAEMCAGFVNKHVRFDRLISMINDRRE